MAVTPPVTAPDQEATPTDVPVVAPDQEPTCTLIDNETLECIICKDLLMNSEERTALECMHVFHTNCIDEFRNSSGLPLRYCCPYKCFRAELEAVSIVEDGAADAVLPAPAPGVQAVPAPSDLLDAARALQ